MKKILLLAAVFICSAAYSQPTERAIHYVIDHSLAACVRMYAYDTVQHQQAGIPFSGVVTTGGHILTAAHTVTPSLIYRVFFPDGREALAQGLGRLELANNKLAPDAGMIQLLTPGDWPTAPIGRSAAVKRLDQCISISYPESLFKTEPTVRMGYILQTANRDGFIQSSCIMEPGDSGGPLFNTKGEVIALHSAVDVPVLSNFEVPVDWYTKYADSLVLQQTSIVPVAPVKKTAATPDSATLQRLTASMDTAKRKMNVAGIVKGFAGTAVSLYTISHKDTSRFTGTLFSVDTSFYVVCKASLTGINANWVKIGDNKFFTVITAWDASNDLMLLKVVDLGNAAAKIADVSNAIPFVIDTTNFIQQGNILASPLPSGGTLYSVTGCQPYLAGKFFSLGYFGAYIPFKNEGPLIIDKIAPGSPADSAGLLAGDQLTNINGTKLQRPEDFGKILQQCWTGDLISVTYIRDSSASTIYLKLGQLPQIAAAHHHPAEQFAGGPSLIRDGFASKVFSHDAVLMPDQCGGPVFDLQGHFIGINIARHSRASTLVLPGPTIYQFIKTGLSHK
jgi:serine protease Do